MMTQWTEQPDGTWRRGVLVVCKSHGGGWFWYQVSPPYNAWSQDADVAKAAADTWAREMLGKLRELEE